MIDAEKALKAAGLNGLWLAPMAGYTDIAFRELCRSYGAAVTPTEMVSVRGLVRGNAVTETLMRLSHLEKPSCIQLFGSDPDDFYRAGMLIDCDIIDVNMGCPMPKIVKNGDGSALLLDPVRAGEITDAVKRTGKTVTVKTRLGYYNGKPVAAELIKAVSAAGASAVTLHGRYAEQRYAGQSDMDTVCEIARGSNIPVVYNGDVDENNAASVLDEFGAAAVGRAALRNPAIFCGANADPFDIAFRHIELLTKYFDDRYAVNQTRKFFVHYFKGVEGGKAIRAAVNSAKSINDVVRAVEHGKIANGY